MVENNNNRFMIKFNENIVYSNKWYNENKNDVVKLKIRVNKADEEAVKKYFLKKYKIKIGYSYRSNDNNRDKLKDFHFIQCEFNNNTAKDMIMSHLVIVCPLDKSEKIVNRMKKKLNNVITKKNNINGCLSYSITINEADNKLSFKWGTKEKYLNHPKIKSQCKINIVSYNRSNEYGRTHILLTKLKIKHYLFIEPSQEQQYKNWFDPSYCELVIYNKDLSKLKMGSTPGRNYIMNYWRDKKQKFIWVLDDNIKNFYRFNKGLKKEIESEIIFSSVENYVLNCDNVVMASHNFNPFVTQGDLRPCIIKNCKMYSCILVDVTKNLEFEHRHQEDNFISVQLLEKGYCSLCFNHILYNKNTSGNDKGGNREAIYKCKNDKKDGDGYKERFEYFESTLKEYINKKLITLKDGVPFEKFFIRDHTMKSKEYHSKINYKMLKGYENSFNFNHNNFINFDKYLKIYY